MSNQRSNIIILILVTLLPRLNPLIAQKAEITDNSILSPFIEEIMEQNEDEEEVQQLLDDLYELLKNPIDINQASIDELRKIFFLNEFQINSIILYRQEFGEFLSANELKLVPGFHDAIAQKVGLVISLSGVQHSMITTSHYKNLKSDLIIRYKRKIEIPAGFSDGIDSLRRFTGSNHYLLARNELTFNQKIKAGMLIEKDAGESFLSGYNKYKPDHFSGYAELTNDKVLKKIIIGDYKAGFGQGLVAGCTFISKNSDAIITPGNTNLRKSLSASESGNLRGLAAEVMSGNFSSCFFISTALKDARINYKLSGHDSLSYFSTIYLNGLHRNYFENLYRNTLRQFNAGVNISGNFNNFTLGLIAVQTFFNHHKEISVYHASIVPPEYRNNFLNLGIHYRVNLGKIIFYGEWAADFTKHPAVINGMLAQLHPLVSLSMVHRKYSPEYISFLSTAFGKSSSANNEEGFYIGVNIYPLSFLNLSCYADHFSFPWLRQHLPEPASGNDYYINAIFTINANDNIALRYKTSYQQLKTERSETGIDVTEKSNSSNLRLQYNYSINQALNLETRYEQTSFREKDSGNEKGYYFGQKLILKPTGSKTAFWLSYGLFDVADWNNRIYIYEHDVLYDFSIPALYRTGSRFAVMTKTRIFKQCEIWIKYYMSLYENIVKRGAGADFIRSRTDSGMKVQVRIKL